MIVRDDPGPGLSSSGLPAGLASPADTGEASLLPPRAAFTSPGRELAAGVHHRTPALSVVFPLVSLVLVVVMGAFQDAIELGPAWLRAGAPALATAVLVGTVFAALHHAEVIGDRLGEPLGTLLLTLAVTIIEVAIVASLMLHGDNNPTLAREAVFSVAMITCTGLVGTCLFLGALRYREQGLQPQGTSAYLAVLMALSVLILVLPNFTSTTAGPTFSPAQLVFVSVVSILLYGAFLFAQTVRYRTDFLAPGGEAPPIHAAPSSRRALASLAILLAGLAGVVLLAKRVAAGIEDSLYGLGLARPDAIVGAIIGLLILLPEALSAIKAAARNQLQTSLNVALGSALATIGLTVPAVAAVSLIYGRELVLGLDMRDAVLLVLTLAISVVSFGTGRTNMLTGLVHLVLFATFVLFLIVP